MKLRRAALLLLAAAACGDTTLFDPMERQPKFRPFAANPFYEDGRAMRPLPPGTVSREQAAQRPEIASGKDRDGNDLRQIPLPVDFELMARGRDRFDIYCATCHGLLGDGVSPVAAKMSLRPPPNLHALRDASPVHLFHVMSDGYGLMPSYAAQLSAPDRWAVAAYVEALRRSQAATLAQAPADIQKKLREEPAP
jgi:mono/diheme cytochrome c family protein